MKHIQNKVAESRRTLPVTFAICIGIWLAAGLIQHQWWIQFGCFALSVAVMTELDNNNSLIRIYSRAVTASYALLSCVPCFLFPSTSGAVFQLCLVTSLFCLFKCYQDKQAAAWAFYTFLMLGLASMASALTFWLIPVVWLMMATTLYCLSWRTFTATILGLLCPYWFALAWILCFNEGDMMPLLEHLMETGHYILPADYLSLSASQILTFALLTILTITGIVHYSRKYFLDKIRTREIYYSLMMLWGLATLLLIIQPQHDGTMLRVIIIAGSPLLGHFLALTSTRVTNIASYVIAASVVLLTVFNLWMAS